MIVPCIDVMDGQAVQLVGGERKALDLGAPDAWLERFAPFEWIHGIDLDAAKGQGHNEALLVPLLRERKVRVGGGVRSLEAATRWVEHGAAQVIVGTRAFGEQGWDEAFLDALVEAIGKEKLCLAIDTRNRKIQTRGWQSDQAGDALQLVREASRWASAVLCTVVEKEGQMAGTDLEWLSQIRAAFDGQLIAAGGIATLAEVDALLSQGIQVALGMALYTGKLPLPALEDRARQSKVWRASIFASQAYLPPPRASLEPGTLDLSGNENPLGPPPGVEEVVARVSHRLHEYPEAGSERVRQAWADRLALPVEQLVVGNGSDELIHLIGLLTLDAQSQMVTSHPSFLRYFSAGQLAGAEIRTVPLNRDYAQDLEALADACDARTRLVWIANPHNPTGTLIGRKAFETFLDRVPKTAVVVLDEAYAEFIAEGVETPRARDYMEHPVTVIGLQTLSKAFGLAGLRLGAAFGPRWFMEGMWRIREPFSVNAVAQEVGVWALGQNDWLRTSVKTCQTLAHEIALVATRRGWRVPSTQGFFVFVDAGAEAPAVIEGLAQRGIRVRSGAAWGLPHTFRMSVPPHDAAPRVLEALQSVCADVR